MSERENLPAIAPAGEDAPRPKVLRRPPQFSRPVPVPLNGTRTALMVQSAPAHAQTPHGRAWQDDVRFGLALIVGLFLINLVMILLVPHLPRGNSTADETSGGIQFGNAVLPPQEATQEPSTVTLYTELNAEENTTNLFDLNHLDPKTNNFSVSPKDIPPPRAKALDPKDQ